MIKKIATIGTALALSLGFACNAFADARSEAEELSERSRKWTEEHPYVNNIPPKNVVSPRVIGDEVEGFKTATWQISNASLDRSGSTFGKINAYDAEADNPFNPIFYYNADVDVDVPKYPLYDEGKNMDVVFGDRVGMYVKGHLIYVGMTEADLVKALGQPQEKTPDYPVGTTRTRGFIYNGFQCTTYDTYAGEYVGEIRIAYDAKTAKYAYNTKATLLGVSVGDTLDSAQKACEEMGSSDVSGVGLKTDAVAPGSGAATISPSDYVAPLDHNVRVVSSYRGKPMLKQIDVRYEGVGKKEDKLNTINNIE
ncbi:hypothetical protein FACS1894188_07070 [Clostridia bacterium]|nr:hypothetical protein FACS1894188_07070 [Clostridia bacterium]